MANDHNALCLTCENMCKQYSFVHILECPKYENNGSRPPKLPPTQAPLYRELRQKEKTDMKNLITFMCANYDRHYKECLLLGTVCPMFTLHYYKSNKEVQNGVDSEPPHCGSACKYFEHAVLPLNKELMSSLKNTDALMRACAVCGKKFVRSGKRKYCSDICGYEAHKRRSKKGMEKMRENQG